MPRWLATSSDDFGDDFRTLLEIKREQADDVDAAVCKIIAAVREKGDEALYELTLKFDEIDLRPLGLRISQDEIHKASLTVPSETMDALKLARDRIETYHLRQRPKDDHYTDPLGVELGLRWRPIGSVGIYVPGGTASYPSSVLMNAVPALVAGVKRIAMVVPTPGGALNPLVLAAANLLGIDEIYRIGGAQAIAALAFGTPSLAPVAKIVGPGNAYVASAKRHVFGTVGIDMVAGPSEVLIIADNKNNPDWIAADLLAQAEHDPSAQSILMTDDRAFGMAVSRAVERQLEDLPRANIASASWENFGAILILEDLREAPPLVDRLAPEHLEIVTDEPDLLATHIENAGAIFLGCHTPEVIGDYIAGPNHVLPTARSARFSSGLGVLDFMKRSSLLKLTAESLKTLGPAAQRLAREEGLEGHYRSIAIRLDGTGS